MTLFEKAKAVPQNTDKRHQVNPEQLELVLAWLHGDITTKQAHAAYGGRQRNASNFLVKASTLLHRAVEQKLVRIEQIKGVE